MRVCWLDLGLIDYAPAFAIQERILEAYRAGRRMPTVILQENYPVFTVGRSGSKANVLASREELAHRGIQVLSVNRGGDVTYHAPGQLIVSPLLYLGDVNLNANQYLHCLEDILLQLLHGYGIEAGKKKDYPGVWLEGKKIAAVGIAVRHGFTFHGFSINVDLDLDPFSWINPCGVPHMPVTSLRETLGRGVEMAEIKDRLRDILGQTFALEFEKISLQELTWNTN